ncbi:MAG: hypothetical protein GY898_05510 [Proteobacteria bacterium]|nr:hypothetical protein [Pseudomonadota bacterium]
MKRPPIELEIREPTGLELGTFDVYMVRQKIFGGELQPRCEFRDVDGEWKRLTEHAAFSEVFWLLGKDPGRERGKRVARFGGWQGSARQKKPTGEASIRLDGGRTSGRHDKPGSGLLRKVFGKK